LGVKTRGENHLQEAGAKRLGYKGRDVEKYKKRNANGDRLELGAGGDSKRVCATCRNSAFKKKWSKSTMVREVR